MAEATRERDDTQAEAVRPPPTSGAARGEGEQLVARGGGDQEAYAGMLREQPGAMEHGASALHAQFGNAYAMQVMDGVEDSRGASTTAAAKVPSLADFEKEMAVLRNRYDARMRALSDAGEEVQNNPGLVPGDPGIEYRLNDPIVSGNRLIAETKRKIDELEDAKSHEKAGGARWNKLNRMQQDLIQWGGILWDEEQRYREILKKRGFTAKNVEPFP